VWCVLATTRWKTITWAWQGKKLHKQQQQQYKQTDRQTDKQTKNIKGMSYDSTDHSAQFLAKNIRLDEEIDNPAAS